MVILMVDEAAAYDALSILYVKQDRQGKAPNGELDRLVSMLCHQLGHQKHIGVVNSEEFHKLHESNGEVFDLVDMAGRNEVAAAEVVTANLKRYERKRELQQKHFGGALSEVKL